MSIEARAANYVTEYRSFLREARETGLAATPQLMYLHLLDIANEADWPEELGVSNQELCRRLGCSDESILRARHRLVKMGRLAYLGQRGKKPLYRMCYYSRGGGKAVDNPVEGEAAGRPWPPVEKPEKGGVSGGVEQAVEQPVEHGMKWGEEQGRPGDAGEDGVEQGVEHAVEQGVESAVESPVESPVERAVERPVECCVESPVKSPKGIPQRANPKGQTPKSSSSSSSARGVRDAREGLRALLSEGLYPPGPAEEPLIAAWARDFDPGIVEDMLQLALKRDARTYRYLEVGLDRLRTQGITTMAAYRASEEAFQQRREMAGRTEPGVPASQGRRPVKEVAQHRYGAQRSYDGGHWEGLVADPFADARTET